MKLKIDAFRSIQGREYLLPDSGLVRVSGVSGAGKSTIFEALEFLFWGTAGNTSPYGAKKTKVSMSWHDLAVVRSKYPDKLLVNDDVDDSAQETLRRFLGVSEAQFGCSGYVRQDMSSGVLALSPADQLRLVQNLAFEGVDPEDYKAKVKVFTSGVADTLTVLETRITNLRDQVTQTTARLEGERQRLSIVPDPEPFPPNTRQPAEAATAIQDARARWDRIQSVLQSLNAEMASPDRALDAQIASIKSAIDEAQKQSTDFRAQADAVVPPSAEERARLSSRQQALLAQQTAFSTYRDVLSRHQSATATLASAENAWRVASMSDSLSFELLSRTRSALEAKLQEAHTRQDPVACPQCGASLMMEDGALVHARAPVEGSISEYISKLEKIDQKYGEMSAAHVMLQNAQKAEREAAVLLGATFAAQDPSLEMAELQEQMTQVRLVSSNHAMLTQRADSAAQSAAEKVRTLQQLTSRLQSSKLRSIEAITLEISQLNEQTALVGEEIRTLDAEIQRGREWQARENSRAVAVATRAEQEKGIATAEAHVEQLRSEIARIELEISAAATRLGAAQRLIPIITEASTRTVGSIVAAINDSANSWVEKFFPSTGTRVMLRNIKVNKDETRRAQMSTVVVHDGHECRLQDMSGGERSRIILAFQLAMSTMFRCPILMLDEPFKGLDPDLRLGCMEALQEFAVDRLVLVAEHTIDDSWFDAVIKP